MHVIFTEQLCNITAKISIINTDEWSMRWIWWFHYNHVIMGVIASQINRLTIVYSTVYSGADQRKHESSASLAFVRGIHRGPVNSPHKWPVTRKIFPFDDVISQIAIRVFCLDLQCYMQYRFWIDLLWRYFIIIIDTTIDDKIFRYCAWNIFKYFSL